MPTALVTGANRGIGLELARQLSAAGYTVIGTARQPDQADDLQDVAEVEACDVASDASVAAMAERLGDRPIDLLVNNAGLLEYDRLESATVDSMRRQFEVNALGPFRVTAALRGNLTADAKVAMVTSRMGSIADNTSGGAYGYRSSKAALNMIAMSFAKDLPQPVAILHPGMVQTAMTGGHGDVTAEEAARKLLRVIDGLTAENSGTFWHREGHELPW